MTQEMSKKSSLLGGIDITHDYRVKIPFSKQAEGIVQTEHEIHKNINNWNETCARAIEMFGLPGQKYTCRMTKEAIEFWFLEEKDALLFELTCG